MRVIHNNLQRGCEATPPNPPSVMDRLKNNLHQLCPLLRARYRKLLDDHKENIPLLIQNRDYVSYSCSCCGRTQKIQAEELNAIVSSAFRLAYAARLQQRSAAAAAAGRGQVTCPGDSMTSPLCCQSDGADKINNRTSWGRRSRHSSRRGGKSVNLCPASGGGGGGADPAEVARLAPELRLLSGYANEATSVSVGGDQQSQCSEHESAQLHSPAERGPAPFSDGSHSARDDDRGSHWSGSGSGCGSTCSSQPEGADSPAPPFYRHQQGPTPEQVHLRHAAWFQAGIPREIALEVLSREPVGAFMVRESTTKHGCYALSLRVPRDFHVSGIAHYLILNTNKGYKIKGFMKEFKSLTALIVHHSVMPELLPCTLSLSRYHPEFARAHAAASATDMEELLDTADSDYNGLSQLSSSATADTTV